MSCPRALGLVFVNKKYISMSLVIRTGFEEITHDKQFNPASIDKGKLLVESQHVVLVEELQDDKLGLIIRGYVIRQASVNKEAYRVYLFVSKNEKIYSLKN